MADAVRRHRILIMTGAALFTVGFAACSEDDRDDVGDAVEEIGEEAQEAVETAVSEVEDAIDEAAQDAAELIVRNLATQQGEEQFSNAGQPLDDNGLDCTAEVTDGLDGVSVECTGTTQEGGAAALTGSTDELPGASAIEIEGQFTGTVDGEEVFNTDTLGG